MTTNESTNQPWDTYPPIYLRNFKRHLKNAGKFLYLVDPRETTFENPNDVPDYMREIWLSFFVLVALEHVILFAKNESSFRLNDHITSLSHWIFNESGRIIFRGAEYWTYMKIYDNCRISTLPWDSPWTWYVTVIGVDFCYYWVHRANHEIHLLWAQHQVHHSSEEFSLVVGLRQSILQNWCGFIFYLPLALIIPPSHFLAHHQFNLIYQLWIHTSVVKDLGILEYVLNTPKHHRVHHGCNLYCLDKNYGGVFIVWDRLFGTFAEEKPREKIIYGLVSSPGSFNPSYLQAFYTKAMIDKFRSMDTWGDKLSVIWKGPSWSPGMPRLGLDEFKIHVTSRIPYNIVIPAWKNIYVLVQFCIVGYAHSRLYDDNLGFNAATIRTSITNNIFALTTIGMIFDDSHYVALVELFRCMLFLNATNTLTSNTIVYYLHVFFSAFWTIYALRRFKRTGFS